MPGIPVRDPWPADINIGANLAMLGMPEKGGKLVATRPQTLDQVAPPEYFDDAQNPLFARPQVYADLSLGLGQKTQQGPNDRKYYYGINADLSQSYKWLKGPAITQVTPNTHDSTNGALDFFEIGGALYYLNGRYALKRTNDSTFGSSKDFNATTAGATGLTARLFRSAASSGNLIFVSMGSSTPDKDWYYDGTTWTQMASFQSLDYISVGREFYRASDVNLLSKCDSNADPTTEANWSAPNAFRIGDKSSAIRRLGITATGVLIVFKTDGVYSIDGSGQDVRYFPYLALNPDPNSDSAKQVGYFGNDVYVQYDGGLFKITPDFSLQQVGPELIPSNDSPVKGYVTAFMGAGPLYGYAGLYNPDSGNSYLLKFGAWTDFRTGAFGGSVPTSIASRVDAWHGSISSVFTGVKITAMWQSAIGAASGHSRMWLGFSDGSYAYFNLSCVPDPSACSQYLFSTTDGQVFLPLFTAGWLGDAKALRSFVAMAPNLSATNYLQLKYKADSNAGSYTDLGVNLNMAPRQKANFPSGIQGSQSDLQVVLVSSSTASCPQVTGVVLYHAVRPEFLLLYIFLVLAFDGLVDRTGHPMRAGAIEIREFVRQACAAPGSVTTILPDESNKQLSYKDYDEAMAWDDRTQQWGAALSVKAYEFVANVTYGTWARVGIYTWGQVANYLWSQVSNI